MSRLHLVIAFLAALLAGCAALQKGADQTISVAAPMKDVAIKVDYAGGVFYRMQVSNALPSEIKLLWDDSTYVTTDGKSVRILQVGSRYGLPEYAPARQTASAIAPGSTFTSDFTGEEWLDCARRNCTPQPKDHLGHAKIILTFEIKGKQVRWQGDVAFAPPKQP